ncbi:hypothetical protein AB1J88_28115 [Pseudomonas sp. S8]|uniref:hypothetical protein n=1 Tax=Pseudomonas sp. S8 TaxID=211136 RepID=UPI003D2887EB
MNTTDIALDEALLTLPHEVRVKLADLIEAERKQSLRWWTFLNEMRCRGDLPEWVKTQYVGTQADYGRYAEARLEFNKALFGKKVHIRDAGEPVFESVFFDDLEEEEGEKSRKSSARQLGEIQMINPVKAPMAVLQHRQGENTLASTNMRKES